jgi:hypothetical protein
MRIPLLMTALMIDLVAGGLAGCSNSGRVAAENDRLRLRVVELEDEVADLSGRHGELEAHIAALEADEATTAAAAIRAGTPRVVAIEIGRLSHLEDLDGDSVPDRAVIYVHPRDGMGRFVQIVGHLDAHVAILPVGADARTLGRVSLLPGELREAYRSGFTGTHYTIEVPLTLPAGAGEDLDTAVKVEFSDGLTERTLSASGTVTTKVIAAGVSGE